MLQSDIPKGFRTILNKHKTQNRNYLSRHVRVNIHIIY